MSENEILRRIKRYFNIKELVSKEVYLKYGEMAWVFFDIRLLHTLLIIREGIGSPIIVNNWHKGGHLSQCGLRENTSKIVQGYTKKGEVYLSGHVTGKALDFDVIGMKALDVRKWIEKNYLSLPYSIRLEKDVIWVHLDIMVYSQYKKVFYFEV